MGIPAYLSYIIKNYKGIINSLTNSNYVFNHLYFDANSIIYDSYRELQEKKVSTPVITHNSIIDSVIKKLDFLIEQINPLNTIFIALDGVAPFSKINQQRQRRFRVSLSLSLENKNTETEFSTIEITPGTEFMELLSLRLTRHFENRAIISGSNNVGEGEHKIFKHIRENKENNRFKKDETFVIYGLDADLIMIAINHLYISKNIFIFRETPEFHGISTDTDIFASPYTLLNIDKLAYNIEQYTCASPQSYIFLCFLLGNDFLPHFPALNLRTNGMDILLESYKKNTTPTTPLIKNGKIQWRVLYKMLLDISKNERNLFIEKTKDRDILEKKIKYLPIKKIDGGDPSLHNLHSPILNRELEKYICPEEDGWETRYYRVLFEKNIDINSVCLNLLYGLEWNFKYYSGDCIDWRWNYKYHYAPLLSDFIKFIPHFETTFFNSTINTEIKDKPLHHFTQLACVLPYKHLNLLPKIIQKYIDKNYLFLYPEKNNIEEISAYCRYNWEGHLLLPEITTEFLENIELLSVV